MRTECDEYHVYCCKVTLSQFCSVLLQCYKLTLLVLMLIKVDIRGRVLKLTKVDVQGSNAVT